MLVFKYSAKKYSSKLNSELKNLQSASYSNKYASLCLPEDENMLNIVEAASKLKKRLNPVLIVVIGIGGSNLGTIAIQEALLGKNYNLHNKIKIMYADTVDPDSLQSIIIEMQNTLRQGSQVLLNVISKSGTTTETIVNFEILYNVLKRHRKDADEYVVATTDKNSKVWDLAIKKAWSVLEIPKNVGGRYSVFSPVGLFPLAMLNLNIRDLIKGAREMKSLCLSDKSPAAIGATELYDSKKPIYDLFMFSSDFESLGKWYRQLLAESCGKTKKAITPTVSIGSTDLHSVAQLYLGGPDDKLTTFITTIFKNKLNLPDYPEFNSIVNNIQKKEINMIMRAISQGTKIAYKKNKRIFNEIRFDGKSEYNMGAFMQLKMIETILLAKLLNVNPFDQPAVEKYKSETRKLLSN